MRPLRADEIEVRIGTVTKNGVSFLLYKNARVDMAMLDETYGEYGWQRDHKELKGNIYCGIGVYDANKDEWVWKWDCGTESYTEKEKGEASDSFKRAGFCWGIGRELYTSPFIFFKAPTHPKKDGRGFELDDPYGFARLKVSDIRTEDRETKRVITYLELSMGDQPVWTWMEQKTKQQKAAAKIANDFESAADADKASDKIPPESAKMLQTLLKKINKLDPTFWDGVKDMFEVERVTDIRLADFGEITRLAQAKYELLSQKTT